METKVWVVQVDKKEKDDYSSTRHVFYKREDAFAYVKKVMENSEKYMVGCCTDMDRKVNEERCNKCTDNTECRRCEWCISLDDEKGRKCCINENQFEVSPRSYFYFETHSGYDDYWNGQYYNCGIILEQLIIQ